MKAISATTCERAWYSACRELIRCGSPYRLYNLVVEVLQPAVHGEEDNAARAAVDGFLRSHSANPVHTVVGTIFPVNEYLDHGEKGVYSYYPDEVYPVIKKGWGTYAHRLLRSVGPSGEQIRPLEELISKMRQQLANGKRFRACYEISLANSAIDLPLYDPVKDRKVPRGGPCLSHVSFKLGEGSTLYLTAMYRSHSYIERALGNFLGLAALQAFVCDMTGLNPGPLVCLSTYAQIDKGKWGVEGAKGLVDDVGRILGEEVGQ